MKKIIGALILIIIIAAGGIYFYVLSLGNQNSFPVFSKEKYIAGVNREGITREDYQKRLDQTTKFLTFKQQDASASATAQNDVLGLMVAESLVGQYAKENNITVSDSEVASRYQQVVAGFNKREGVSEGGDAKFLERIKQMYGSDKNIYLAQVKMDLLKEKVQQSVGKPLVKWLEAEKQKAHIQSNL